MMLRRFASGAVALMIAGSSAGVAAQDSARDAKCLLVSNFFARSAKDEKARQVAALATVFYLGRLDGRLPSAQLEAALRTQGKALSLANAGPAMQSCGTYMQERMQALEATGKKLSQTTK